MAALHLCRKRPTFRKNQGARTRRWLPSAYGTVATIAITLSVLGTSLAGIKQFYDPGRLVSQNQRALVKLWKLHQQVVLGVKCKIEDTDLNEWKKQLSEAREKVVPAYGAYLSAEESK
jgi:hypothetical protein